MLERINYRGWQNSYRIFNPTVELVVLADVGPRIISYGFQNGENVLHEVPEHAGITGGREFRLYGGHRLWRWPELASTYFPDNFPVAVSEDGNSVRFTAPLENEAPGNGLQKQLRIQLEDRGLRVMVEHCITNRNDHAIELAPWAPTMMKPGGRAILPLPPRAADASRGTQFTYREFDWRRNGTEMARPRRQPDRGRCGTTSRGFENEKHGSWSKIASLPAGASEYSDTAAKNGQHLAYRVRAVNAEGESAYLNIVRMPK